MEIEKEDIVELQINIAKIREEVIACEGNKEGEINVLEKEIQAVRATYQIELDNLNDALVLLEAELQAKLLALGS